MSSTCWLTAAVILTFAVIFVNGWTDAPNAIAAAVATGALPMRRAAALAAAFNCLGAVVMCRVSPAVAYSVGSIVNLSAVEASPEMICVILCASLLTIVLWSVGAWAFGIPTSESHSLIAALTGAALALCGDGSVIRWDVWRTVVVGLFASMAVGFAAAYLACFGLERGEQRNGRSRSGGHRGGFCGSLRRRRDLMRGCVKSRENGGGSLRRRGVGRGFMNESGGACSRSRNSFRKAQVGCAMAMAFMHGAQDGQKFLAILLLMMQIRIGSGIAGEAAGDGFGSDAAFGISGGQIPLWMAAACALVMGLGTATGGRRIVEKVGKEMVRLKPRQGCAADGAAALCLLGASLLGFPVSTTHVKTAAILGAGLCGESAGAVRTDVVKELMITWIVTFPGCILLGYVLTRGMLGWCS